MVQNISILDLTCLFHVSFNRTSIRKKKLCTKSFRFAQRLELTTYHIDHFQRRELMADFKHSYHIEFN